MNRNRPKQIAGIPQTVLLMAFIMVALVVAGLIGAFGLQIMTSVSSGFVQNTSEANVTRDFKLGAASLAEQAPNVGRVAAAVIIIGLLITGFLGILAFKQR